MGLLGGRPPEWVDEVGVMGGSADWRPPVPPNGWWWWGWWTLRYGVRGTTGKAGVTGRFASSPLSDECHDMTLSCTYDKTMNHCRHPFVNELFCHVYFFLLSRLLCIVKALNEIQYRLHKIILSLNSYVIRWACPKPCAINPQALCHYFIKPIECVGSVAGNGQDRIIMQQRAVKDLQAVGICWSRRCCCRRD